MSEFDCETCGKFHSEMLTPIRYRCKWFCSEKCKNVYKTSRPPLGDMKNKGSRTTPCGP